MGIIESQRQHIEAEIKQARHRQRLAEQAAEAERSKYKWAKSNPSWACEANFQIMENYLGTAGILVSEDSLDLALRALRNNLAERVLTPVVPELTAEERRIAENDRLKSLTPEELRAEIKANTARKLAHPNFGGYGSVFVPPFTAKEFLQMSPSKVRDLLQYPGSNQERPGVRAAIDKLLQDAATKSNQ